MAGQEEQNAENENETREEVETSTEETTNEETQTEERVFNEDYVKGLRDEAADWRTKLRKEQEEREKLTAKIAEYEKAKLSEEERLKLEWEELRDENSKLKRATQETRLEAAVAKNMGKFELADADATLKLLVGEVEYDSSGRPTNIEDVLTATLESYPFLKKAPEKKGPTAPNPGSTNPGRQKGGGSLTRESIQKMSHAERVERMDEINKWMAGGYK